MLAIRELHAAELPPAVQLLARGMRDDPMHCTVFGSDVARRLDRLGRFFGALLPLMGHPPLSAWDAGRLVGVFAQFPPGTCRPPLRQQLRIALPLLTLKIGELWRLWRWVGASEAHDLAERHWHLGPVAVDVDRQGQGAGGQLLRAFCARMDEQGAVAFLETDKLASVRFYARCGFKVTAHGEVLGTPNWWMRRPPRLRRTEGVIPSAASEAGPQ
jgi:GNAT superfamily N-acetyltransferase